MSSQPDKAIKLEISTSYNGKGAEEAQEAIESLSQSKAPAQLAQEVGKAQKAIESLSQSKAPAQLAQEAEKAAEQFEELTETITETTEQITTAGEQITAVGEQTVSAGTTGAAATKGMGGAFQVAATGAKAFRNALGWMMGWMAVANQVVELFKKIHEWWTKDDTAAAEKKKQILEETAAATDKVRQSQEALNRAYAAAANNTAITAAISEGNALWAERIRLINAATAAEGAAAELAARRDGNELAAAKIKLDTALATGQITATDHALKTRALDTAAAEKRRAQELAAATGAVEAAQLKTAQGSNQEAEANQQTEAITKSLGSILNPEQLSAAFAHRDALKEQSRLANESADHTRSEAARKTGRKVTDDNIEAELRRLESYKESVLNSGTTDTGKLLGLRDVDAQILALVEARIARDNAEKESKNLQEANAPILQTIQALAAQGLDFNASDSKSVVAAMGQLGKQLEALADTAAQGRALQAEGAQEQTAATQARTLLAAGQESDRGLERAETAALITRLSHDNAQEIEANTIKAAEYAEQMAENLGATKAALQALSAEQLKAAQTSTTAELEAAAMAGDFKTQLRKLNQLKNIEAEAADRKNQADKTAEHAAKQREAAQARSDAALQISKITDSLKTDKKAGTRSTAQGLAKDLAKAESGSTSLDDFMSKGGADIDKALKRKAITQEQAKSLSDALQAYAESVKTEVQIAQNAPTIADAAGTQSSLQNARANINTTSPEITAAQQSSADDAALIDAARGIDSTQGQVNNQLAETGQIMGQVLSTTNAGFNILAAQNQSLTGQLANLRQSVNNMQLSDPS